METPNVFTQNQSTQTTDVQTDALTTKLLEIKNEQGQPKYANVETALDALAHSQSYIPELKTQLDNKDKELLELRTQLARTQGVQEALERFQTAPQAPEATTPVEPQAQNLEEQILNVMQRQQQMTQQEQNAALVNKTLNDAFGEKAFETVSAKAQSLNMTVDALQDMAKSNPQLVLSLFNTGKPTSTPNTLQSSVASQLTNPPKDKLKRPEKSMLMGSTFNEVNDFMKQVRAEVYEELGVES